MSETPTSEREAKVRLPSQARVLWLSGLLGVSLLVGYLSSHLQRGAIWSVPLPNVDQVLIAAAHEDLDEIVLVTSSSSRSPKGSRITTYSLGTGAVRSVWEDSRVFPTLQSRATAKNVILFGLASPLYYVRIDRATGQIVEEITEPPLNRIFVSKTGTHLAKQTMSSWEILKVGEPDPLVRLLPHYGYPTWSPDERHVSFISSSNEGPTILIVSLETGRTTETVVEPKPRDEDTYHYGAPLPWQSNHRLVDFISSDKNNPRMYVLELAADGTISSQLSTPEDLQDFDDGFGFQRIYRFADGGVARTHGSSRSPLEIWLVEKLTKIGCEKFFPSLTESTLTIERFAIPKAPEPTYRRRLPLGWPVVLPHTAIVMNQGSLSAYSLDAGMPTWLLQVLATLGTFLLLTLIRCVWTRKTSTQR